MRKKQRTVADHDERRSRPHRMRLPGFISETEIGLGDAIERATSYIGFKPCRGCHRRAAALNNWLLFTSKRSR
jgi:hypothetical protein